MPDRGIIAPMEQLPPDTHNQLEASTPERPREQWIRAGQAAMMVSDVFNRAVRTGLPVSPELGRLADEMLALLADEKIALVATDLSTDINDFFEDIGLYGMIGYRLRDNGINTLEDLLTISERDLMRVHRQMTPAYRDRVIKALADRGLKLRSEE